MIFGVALSSKAAAAEWHEWSAVDGNGHYYSVTETAMTWFDAQSLAASTGGYLTSIGNIDELDFIRTTFGRYELFWTGLSSLSSNGVFEWENGDAVTFAYFGAHQPDPSQPSAVTINNVNSRGITRGFFYDVSPNQLFRAIIEHNTDPTVPGPQDGGPSEPPVNGVPDEGSTGLLLGAAFLAATLGKLVRL